jgi:hypothetical protein
LLLKADGRTWDSDLSFFGELASLLLSLSGSAIGEVADNVAGQLLGAFVPPDPFVRIYVDGVRVGQTASPEDVYEPTWEDSFEIEVSESSSVTIQLIDEDISFDDPVGTLSVRGHDLLQWVNAGPVDVGPFGRVATLVIGAQPL